MDVISDETIVLTLERAALQLIEQSNEAIEKNILEYVKKPNEYKAQLTTEESTCYYPKLE